jgi:hypothetical protein
MPDYSDLDPQQGSAFPALVFGAFVGLILIAGWLI